MTNARAQSTGAAAHVGARALLFILLPCAVVLALAGCNVLGVLAAKTTGPPAVPPQYVPAKDQPMLVLVENFRNPAAVRLDAERLGRHITTEIAHYKIAPTVDAGALEELRARPDFATMTQGQIGQAAGAKQVLYVNLLKFNIEDALGSEMIRGQVEMTVKVVDAETGKTRWPADTPDGQLLTIETPYRRTGAGTGPSGGGPGATEIALRESMCRQMAGRVGRLFRRWKPDEEADGGDAGR